MSTLTIRLPEEKHKRLRVLAAHRGTSMNKLFEEFCTKALTEFEAEVRFHGRAAKGDPKQSLAILEKLDQRR